MSVRFATVAVLIALFLCPTALAAPVTVQLRVEGATATIYEGPVTTDAKTVAKSGGHRCDGTAAANGGTNPTPGPTALTALDDGFPDWGGSFSGDYKDYFVTRIGADDDSTGKYFAVAIARAGRTSFLEEGACHVQVQQADEVIWGYDGFGKPFLRLTGPATTAVGQPLRIGVANGVDGSPVAGAAVGGTASGSDGSATVCFDTPGTRRLKAERADAVRSNALVVAVTAGTGSCPGAASGGPSPAPITSAPTSPAVPRPVAPRAAPSLRLIAPRTSARYRRGPRVITGRVNADGLRQVYLRIRRIARGGCSYYSGSRERFTRPRTCARARYARVGDRAAFSYLLPRRLERGRYIVDVKALDGAGAAVRQRLRFVVLR